MQGRKLLVGICLLALAPPRASQAVITFNQLAEDVFVVSHRVKFIGSRAQAMKLAYTKAASLCVAAGYTHFEILAQESEAAQEDDSANASIRMKLFMAGGQDRLACDRNANPEHVLEARNKLAKRGYQPPDAEEMEATAAAEPSEESAGTPTGSCTIEQIVAMVEAGLTVRQVKAACPVE